MNLVLPSPFLRGALWLDAGASAPLALLQLAAVAPLAAWTGLAQPLVAGTGVLMLLWAVLLAGLARRPLLARGVLQAVIGGNLAWALAAAALAATLRPPLPGLALLALHTVAVTAFALLQALGLARSAPAAR